MPIAVLDYIIPYFVLARLTHASSPPSAHPLTAAGLASKLLRKQTTWEPVWPCRPASAPPAWPLRPGLCALHLPPRRGWSASLPHSLIPETFSPRFSALLSHSLPEVAGTLSWDTFSPHLFGGVVHSSAFLAIDGLPAFDNTCPVLTSPLASRL